ncbi:hypothetical protein QQS21_011800 [Conoideocrella luteorostrata]|uniref:Uncharacterized protein n=1 Tax=Conoideocrella luteorostrata TaxID=1105319 RepID=A0AAJ0CCG4_9HYPO|nr:hypothetical protein QQS21_011800 [Conoideocrella luteorostrata]
MAKLRESLGATAAEPAAEPRKRGRPKGITKDGLPAKPYVPTGRPRGRPKSANPKVKVPSGRPRGRPKGSGGTTSGVKKTPTKTGTASAGKRGRPSRDAAGGRAATTAATAKGGPKNGRGKGRKSETGVADKLAEDATDGDKNESDNSDKVPDDADMHEVSSDDEHQDSNGE